MATLTIAAPATLPSGEIVAVGVTAEDYLARYAETFHEWVRGAVIHMSPVSAHHDLLTAYLRHLLDTYFVFHPAGSVRSAPFVMRLDSIDSMREPDLQVILSTNPGSLTETAMIGPADLCIEVVSAESATRDYGDKRVEYEKAGVQEYWIIDPLRQTCQFYRLQPPKRYVLAQPDEQEHYRTPLLPRLVLSVPALWQTPLPNPVETMQAVQAMFAD